MILMPSTKINNGVITNQKSNVLLNFERIGVVGIYPAIRFNTVDFDEKKYRHLVEQKFF